MSLQQGHRKLVCAFANPLEIDNHNKTEAGAIMEVRVDLDADFYNDCETEDDEEY